MAIEVLRLAKRLSHRCKLMANDAAIELQGVGKRYVVYTRPIDRLLQSLFPGSRRFGSEFWALRDVSISIRRGETLGIIGPNGSGKSTLLKVICGTTHPTFGTVSTNGRIGALLELGAGFNGDFTGRENAYLSGLLHGLSKQQIDRKLSSIESFAELGEFFDRPVKSYSSGMYVRLGFAVIAHLDIDTLVVDEALAVGDAYFVQKCMRFIRSFQQRGTIIFVSHDAAAVVSLCQRALWMDHGNVRAIGSAKDLTEAYLGDTIARLQGESPSNLSPKQTVVTDRIEPNLGPAIPESLRSADSALNFLDGFAFDPNAPSFGRGGARIHDVRLENSAGRPITSINGGEIVTLLVSSKVLEPLAKPIIGFIVKDRLGQGLFSENTCTRYSDYPVASEAGDTLEARFTFRMPILPVGDYAIAVAVADGSQFDHVQHHWIHEALCFRSLTSSVSTGLVGIPMLDVNMMRKGT